MLRNSALAIAIFILSASGALAQSVDPPYDYTLGNQIDLCRLYENPTGYSKTHTRLTVDACVNRLQEGRSVGIDNGPASYPQQGLTDTGE